MTSNNDIPTEDETDFVLKHRITGAAFLIFFGVLFLPWLLSAPSQSLQANDESIDLNSEQASRSDIEQELLAAIENENVVEEDLEIYVSRITPLDAQNSEANTQTSTENSSATVENTQATESDSDKPVVVEQEIDDSQLVKVVEPPKESDTNTEEPEETIEVKEPSVDIGWVVQVGVFTDSKGAAKVVSDLKSKGFDPSTTIVDTNMGKATGTRVWLGPYAQRVDAAKSKTSLKDRTGGDGFIRAYP